MLTASKQDFPQISLTRAQLQIPWLPGFKAHQLPVTAPLSLLSITPLPCQRPMRQNMTHMQAGSCFHLDGLLSPWPAR